MLNLQILSEKCVKVSPLLPGRQLFTCKFMHFLTLRLHMRSGDFDSGANEVQSCF